MKERKNIDIMPRNSNGQSHGYNEWYDENKLWIRVVYKNGEPIGYGERHWYVETNFFIR